MRLRYGRVLPFGMLAFLLAVTACNHPQQVDTEPLDQAGMWYNSIAELKALDVSNAEIGELAKAHDAGLTDASCIALIKLARTRHQPFGDGQSIADLLSAGSTEQTVMELAHLNELGLWAGEARILRLAGLSDKVILAVAQRRSQGSPVMSEKKIEEVRNTGASDATILEMVQKGVTDQEASQYIAQRERAAGGHSFVYQGHARKKKS